MQPERDVSPFQDIRNAFGLLTRLAGLGHTPSAHARNPDAGSPQGKRQRRHLRRAAELAPDLALVGKLDRHLRGLGARDQAEPSAKG